MLGTEVLVFWCLAAKVLKFGFEKRGILTKSVQWRFLERDYFIFIMISNQTNHGANMFLPY